MEPDDDKSHLHRGSIGCGVLIGAAFSIAAWWAIYKLIMKLID